MSNYNRIREGAIMLQTRIGMVKKVIKMFYINMCEALRNRKGTGS